MKLILFFILLFVGANSSGELPMDVLKDILIELQNSTSKIQSSVDQLSTSVAENKKYINDLHNQSSSNSEMLALQLDEIQNLIMGKTVQIIDQKFTSISVELQKSALNTKKLEDSIDQLNLKHKETSSILKTLENKLNDIQETEKLLDQNIVSNSEDHQKFGHQLDSIHKLLNKQETPNFQILIDDCLDLYNLGRNISTSYLLQKYNRTVECDMETEGGGWLVIQKRRKLTNQVNFTRDWVSYKEGFGDLNTEFWIGNEFLHHITNQKSYELHNEMEDFEQGPFYATYSEFRVENEESGYKLHVRGYEGYEGNVSDSLVNFHHKMKFTTFDRDNDKDRSGNCAKSWSGGFWFSICYQAHLNGMFPTVPDRENEKMETQSSISGTDQCPNEVSSKTLREEPSHSHSLTCDLFYIG